MRLKGYDYSQAGAYFVTICIQRRECLLGEIVAGEMRLNYAGRIVQDEWNKIREHFPHADIDEAIVKPNHVHGIVIMNTVGVQFIAPAVMNETALQNSSMNQFRNQGVINPAPTVGNIVRAFKARCTHMINGVHNTPGHPLWQRN